DPNSRVRLIAAGSVLAEEPGHERAAAVLTGALADPALRLRRAAADFLATLGPRAVPFLGVLRDRAEAETDPELKATLVELAGRAEQGAAEAAAPAPVPAAAPPQAGNG